MDEPLRELMDLIHFTESVSTKIHGVLDEAEIFRIVREEFARSERYIATIALLTDDGSKLEIVETSLTSQAQRAGEGIAGFPMRGFEIDLEKSTLCHQVVREGKTLQVAGGDVIRELFPPPLATRISKALGYEEKPGILTPLRCQDEIIGLFAVSATELAEYFVPSVRNLAQHISSALEMADEYAERRRVEETLRRSQQRYEALIHSVDGIVWEADTSPLRFTFVSQQAERLLGYPVERWLAEPTFWQDHIHPEDRGWVVEFYAIVIREKRGHEIEYRMIAADGRTVWLRDLVTVALEGDRLVGLRGVMVDITERKRAEEALRESEEKLRSLFESAREGILIVAPDGKILSVNPAAAAMLGYDSPEELTGRFMSDLYADPGLRAKLIEELTEKGYLENYELVLVRKDGTQIHTLHNVTVHRDEQGRIVQVAGFFTDITELKRAEEELAKLASVVQQTADIVFITDRNGVIEYVNPAFERITGYSKEEAIGRTPRLLRSGDTAPEYYEKLWSTILAGKVFRAVVKDRRKNGEFFYYDQTVTPLKDSQGNITHFISTGNDVTQRVQAEEMLRRQRDELAARARIIAAILRTFDLDKRLNRILEEIMTLLDVELGGIYLVEGDRILLRAWRGLSEEFRSRVMSFPRDDPPDWMRVSHVIHSRLDEANPPSDFVEREGIRAWACVPLVLTGQGESQWLGTLVLASRRRDALTQDDARSLEALSEQLALAIDHAWRYRTAEERLTRLRALHEIDRAIIRQRSIHDILQIVLEHVPRELDADAVAVSLLDKGRLRSRVFIMRLPNGTLIEEEAFTLAESLLDWLVDRKEPVAIYDLAQDQRVQMHHHRIRNDNLASYLGVPMVIQDQTIGILHLLTTRPRRFADEDVAFFRTLAGQAAIAIENARLLEETQQRAAYMEALNEIIATATTTSDLRDLLERVLDRTLQTLGLEKGGIWIREKPGTPADLAVERGLPPELGLETARVARSIGLDLFQPQAVADWETVDDQRLPLVPIMSRYGIRSSLSVPLLAENQLVGGLHLASSEPRAWTDKEIALVEAVGRQIGSAAERLRLLSKLQASNQQLQEAVRAKDEMIQNVSHELRTPLTMIRGYTELMREKRLGPLTPQQEEAVEALFRNAERLHFMVHRLLTLQTLDPNAFEQIDISPTEWLERTAKSWQPRAREAGIQIVLDIPPDLPTIRGAPDLLNQVMDNLLDNAIKFSPSGGEVRVSAWREGSELIVAVSDQGIGIPSDKLEKIFERFYQVDGSSTRRFGGMGIGLTLCREIIEGQGGRIWAESAGEGMGSTIYFTLPIPS
ncbi:MAG: PAS domain S-box protein [Chloroflexi bacterium]|nr:PAS domain S-box protein [Chloroflexota bacterium]